MKVSLIFTPIEINPHNKIVAFRDERIGFVPPVSLLYVAAIMEREGVEVDLIDMEAENLSYVETLERIKSFAPDLLGFTVTTWSFHSVLGWIKKFKADTALSILAGGEHIRLYPNETMSYDAIDFCIVGEAELPLPEFIKAFREGRVFEGIRSIGYKKDGKVVIDRTLRFVDDINSVPFPARHLIRNEKYENILSRKKNFTALISSRGCPFSCAFCSHNQLKYRARSPENVVDEIELNLNKHGIRDFDIYDSTFTANEQRVISICEEICRRKLDVGFTVRSRVDVVTKTMINSLKSAGCHTILYGIESSNPDILKMMRKGISLDQVMNIISYTKQCGIKTLGFFLFGFPGETRQTIEDTIRFSLILPLDYALFSILLPMPDTEIYAYYQEHGLGDYWAEYTLDESKNDLIEFIGTDVSRAETSLLALKAYKRFYFRPSVIWNRMKTLSSLGELRRLVVGALGIFVTSGDTKSN